MVEFYIEKGLDVNHFDENGTPLTHAIDQNHIEIAEILLKNGADPNIEVKWKKLSSIIQKQKKKSILNDPVFIWVI